VLLIGIAGKGAAETAGISTDNIANMEGMDPALQASLEKAKAAFSWPNIIGSILLSIIGLVGVILMWKLQKKGFFIYTGAGILGLILPLILGAGFSVFGAIITFAFIAMYALNLKHMK
jgi:CHASE2 domain-containing sensor protein